MNLGKIGEELVAAHYQQLGFALVEANYIPHFGKQMGELDLVLSKERQLVFVEVKTRTSSSFGTPFEAVDTHKQRKLVRTVKHYLKTHPKFASFNYRIDVAAVDIDNKDKPVIILENAIEDFD